MIHTQKKYSKCPKNFNALFLFLQNAYKCSCSPRTYVVEVVPKHLYIAMMDSLRQQFYPRMRQLGLDRKISDSHRKGYSCPMCENGRSRMMQSQIMIFISSVRCLAVIIETKTNKKKKKKKKWHKREREYRCGIRTRDFQAQKRSYRFSFLSPRLTWRL